MKTVPIFLGGGVTLLHGKNEFLKGYRNDVIDPIISQLNSREYVKHFYVAKDYSDLTRNVVAGKHQEIYNAYIAREAQIALFIVDGDLGNITKHEIDIAVASTKKTRHPIVFVYGKNIKDGDEILEYLNQEGIYYQHFFDNRDLAAKIKADIDTATNTIVRRNAFRFRIFIALLALICGSVFFLVRYCLNTNKTSVDNCTAQLYLMRYHDVNALTGVNLFPDSLLSVFKYEDSIMSGSDISVFPILGRDSSVKTTPPFFRLKLHNKHRNTMVFVEAKLEVDQYAADQESPNTTPIPFERISGTDVVRIDSKKAEYSLNGFRHNVAYGETDDRYFFYLLADENCSFRMRVCAKSHMGEYLYSNYIYVKYVK